MHLYTKLAGKGELFLHGFPSQEVMAFYSRHANSPQRWHTPQVIEDLKVRFIRGCHAILALTVINHL